MIFIDIVAIFVTDIVYNLAQILITLLFIFFDDSSITANGRDIRSLVLLTSPI